MFVKPFCVVMMVTLYFGCSPTQHSQSKFSRPQENLNLNTNNDAINKIVFLTFDVTLIDSARDEYGFKLINKTFSGGSLKKGTPIITEPTERGYLYYTLEDKNSKPTLVKVPDPLEMQVEYPGEKQSMQKKTFYRKKGEVTLRFQFEKNSKTISIFKVDRNSQTLKKVYYATL